MPPSEGVRSQHPPVFWTSYISYMYSIMRDNSQILHGDQTTHSLLHLTSEGRIATATMSDPAPMTTASRLCTRDPLPPVVSRCSLAGQVDASSRGQGRASALREVDTVLEDVVGWHIWW